MPRTPPIPNRRALADEMTMRVRVESATSVLSVRLDGITNENVCGLFEISSADGVKVNGDVLAGIDVPVGDWFALKLDWTNWNGVRVNNKPTTVKCGVGNVLLTQGFDTIHVSSAGGGAFLDEIVINEDRDPQAGAKADGATCAADLECSSLRCVDELCAVSTCTAYENGFENADDVFPDVSTLFQDDAKRGEGALEFTAGHGTPKAWALPAPMAVKQVSFWAQLPINAAVGGIYFGTETEYSPWNMEPSEFVRLTFSNNGIEVNGLRMRGYTSGTWVFISFGLDFRRGYLTWQGYPGKVSIPLRKPGGSLGALIGYTDHMINEDEAWHEMRLDNLKLGCARTAAATQCTDAPPDVPNADALDNCDTNVGTVCATAACQGAALMPEGHVLCDWDGMWDVSSFSCKDNDAGTTCEGAVPDVADADEDSLACTNIAAGAECAAAKCKGDYVKIGKIECTAEGKWTSTMACKAPGAKTCEGAVPDVADADEDSLACTNIAAGAECAAAKCKGDYVKTGKIECNAEGEWTSTMACKAAFGAPAGEGPDSVVLAVVGAVAGVALIAGVVGLFVYRRGRSTVQLRDFVDEELSEQLSALSYTQSLHGCSPPASPAASPLHIGCSPPTSPAASPLHSTRMSV
eukprot:TRINITY_DN3649_c0_g2_i2.p1 TRINITY_DN3649_c0_g2~~TRINITY_DN3649_c0_g2_i2.p1  ORF type:complete len:635 (+),score=77.38 TRINITY_DN3649_c0_g2_i2:396-2300(+)